MDLTFSTYCHIERRAGGVGQSPKRFIQAVHDCLKPHSKTRVARDQRHAFIRAVLEKREQLLGMYVNNRF
jgi:hypothetical protein